MYAADPKETESAGEPQKQEEEDPCRHPATCDVRGEVVHHAGKNRTIFEAASRPQRSLHRFAACGSSPCDTLASLQLLHFTSPHTTLTTATAIHDHSHAIPPQ